MAAEDSTKQWEAKLREGATRVEEDLKRWLAYVNDEVVPDVRRNGSAALRSAATELSRLAERIEEANRRGPAPPPPTPRP